MKQMQEQIHIVKKYFITCREINIAFIPYEEQVNMSLKAFGKCETMVEE